MPSVGAAEPGRAVPGAMDCSIGGPDQPQSAPLSPTQPRSAPLSPDQPRSGADTRRTISVPGKECFIEGPHRGGVWGWRRGPPPWARPVAPHAGGFGAPPPWGGVWGYPRRCCFSGGAAVGKTKAVGADAWRGTVCGGGALLQPPISPPHFGWGWAPRRSHTAPFPPRCLSFPICNVGVKGPNPPPIKSPLGIPPSR